MADTLECALDLMRRMPPSQIEDNLSNLLDLVPDLANEILTSVDQPLKVAYDPSHNRDYLLCDYNRDGDSYRSPFSNRYNPPLDGGVVPSEKAREMEVQANEVFDVYRGLYYEGGVASVYCWDGPAGLAAAILIKKTQDQSKSGQPMKGVWDSIHVIEVEERGKVGLYKLVSTVILSLETRNQATGRVSLAGNLTRQEERELPVDEYNDHVINFGRMIEDMEFKLRSTIETIYFGKTKDIVNELRTSISVSVLQHRKNFSNQIGSKIVTN
eukprot:TRINITY_DN3501_c0_g1_i1.p1 TRINITY_DN3501_c0_g1~~TRINITY_DN3501_c0_g1_i1.p1  ORF type:complete len:283 (+),score=49.50 TRINITY_DN3501_c0_g1_i1:41-850(+)